MNTTPQEGSGSRQSVVPAPGRPQHSLVLRWGRALFTRKSLFALVALITFMALFYAVENWRGRRAWEQCRRELEAKGEKLDYLSFVPAPVPDDQNVMEHPFMKEFMIYRRVTQRGSIVGEGIKKLPVNRGIGNHSLVNSTPSLSDLRSLPRTRAQISPDKASANTQSSLEDVQLALAEFRTVFNGLESALSRPHIQINGNTARPFEQPLPSFVAIRFIAQSFVTDCRVNLILGRQDAVMRDLKLLRGLMDVSIANRPPMLVGEMIRVALAGLYLGVIQDGLEAGMWRERDLEELQQELAGLDLMGEIALSLRGGERAAAVQTLTTYAPGELFHMFNGQNTFVNRMAGIICPRGWLLQNLVNVAYAEQKLLDVIDAAPGRIDPRAVDAFMDDHLKGVVGRHQTPYNVFASWAVPNISRATQTVARNETLIAQAIIACALERYHLENGSYPDVLNALPPRLLAQVPRDMFDGQPMRYRRTQDGGYLLYSIGWNTVDDQGVSNPSKGWPHWQMDQGDWVWRAKAPE